MKNLLLSFEALINIAVNNPEGFTVDKNTFEPITTGFAVAVENTQNSFGPAGAARVVNYAYQHQEIIAMGGWLNSDNNSYYFDAVIICNTLDEAIKLGRANKQIAVFNINTMEEIKL